MKSQQEVQDMLDKFDAADQEGELDCDGEAILNALSWVLGHHDDGELTQYLPED
jgi:hypothetical protein